MICLSEVVAHDESIASTAKPKPVTRTKPNEKPAKPESTEGFVMAPGVRKYGKARRKRFFTIQLICTRKNSWTRMTLRTTKSTGMIIDIWLSRGVVTKRNRPSCTIYFTDSIILSSESTLIQKLLSVRIWDGD